MPAKLTHVRRFETYLFIMPAAVVMGAVLLYPLTYGVVLGFFEWNMRDLLKSPVWVGLRNYRELFQDEYFRESFLVTIRFTLSVVSIEFVVGLSMALLLEKGIRGARLFRSFFILPVMIAPVVVGVIWRFLYNPSYGKFNYFLGVFGLGPVGWLSDPQVSLISVIIADIWQWTPFVFLLMLAGLQGIPRDITEASRIDGANYIRELFLIKLPVMRNVITITLVLRMIDAFRVLVVVFNLTYGGPGVSTELLSLRLYKTAFVAQRLGLASANALVLLFLVMFLSILLMVIQSVQMRGR